MNPFSNGTPTKKQRRAHSQAQRSGNPAVHEQEQSANTVRRAIAREEPGVRGHESLQRAAAREDPAVREHECPKRVGSFGYSTLASEEKASEK